MRKNNTFIEGKKYYLYDRKLSEKNIYVNFIECLKIEGNKITLKAVFIHDNNTVEKTFKRTINEISSIYGLEQQNVRMGKIFKLTDCTVCLTSWQVIEE